MVITKAQFVNSYFLMLGKFLFGPLYHIHWGRVMHICVSKLTIIGSDNGLLPGRRQAIIQTSAGIVLIKPLETFIFDWCWCSWAAVTSVKYECDSLDVTKTFTTEMLK